MVNETLRTIEVPNRYKSRASAAEYFTGREEGRVEYVPSEIEQLKNIKSILDSEQLKNAVSGGFITLGIVKPNVNEGKNLPQSDEEAATAIIGEIGEDRIMFQFSIQLTLQQAERFYEPNRKEHSARIIDEEQGLTVWDSNINFISSGPLTFFLFYDPLGEAVKTWRDKMGATNPSNANRGTIRRKHATAVMLPNNLVHGSDSIESALREISVLSDIIGDQIAEQSSSRK